MCGSHKEGGFGSAVGRALSSELSKTEGAAGEVGSSLSLEVFEQMLGSCLAGSSKVSPNPGVSEALRKLP